MYGMRTRLQLGRYRNCLVDCARPVHALYTRLPFLCGASKADHFDGDVLAVDAGFLDV